jgi:hypothetical protein
MSLSLMIAVNVVADLSILGLLAFVMSHARHLTPHTPAFARSVERHATSHAHRQPRTTRRPRTVVLSARS